MSRFKTSTCKGCGKPIVWGKTPDGKTVPLDPRAPVYLVACDTDGGEATAELESKSGSNGMGHAQAHMVSHFATCPQAAAFSRGRKAGGA